MGSRYEEIMSNKSNLPFTMNYLTEWMVEKARKELNETEETRRTGLSELRKLIAAGEDLGCWTDDAYLLQYLRARKFNVKKAYQLLCNFYAVKQEYVEVYPEYFQLEPVRMLYEEGPIAYLPYRDDNGCVVLMVRVNKWNSDKYGIQTALSALTFFICMCVEDVATQVCGVQIVLDVKGTGWRQIKCLTPRYITLLSKALSNTLPVRFKGIHIFNESFIFSYLYQVLKIVLSEKIKKRIHFHGDNGKRLHKLVPKSILPSSYGGDNHAFNFEEWCKKETPVFEERFASMHRLGY